MNTLKPNVCRAQSAERILTRSTLDDDLHTGLVDFLADAMHWCDFTGGDFHLALAQACRHYIHELKRTAGRTEDDPMTRFIGQITVIIDTDDARSVERRLRELAQQLCDIEPAIDFADHNGDVEDYAAIEAECEASLTDTACSAT